MRVHSSYGMRWLLENFSLLTRFWPLFLIERFFLWLRLWVSFGRNLISFLLLKKLALDTSMIRLRADDASTLNLLMHLSIEILGLNALDILLFGQFTPRIDISDDAWNLQTLTNTFGGGWSVANDSRCRRLEVCINRGHISRLGCHWALHLSDLRGRLDFFERAL